MPRACFDLREHPWIPVITEDGTTTRLSLRQVLYRAHTLQDLAVSVPPAASALLRVLYTVTARVTALDDAQLDRPGWERRRHTVLQAGALNPDTVDHYLDHQTGSWDVFDPYRPWMQDPRLAAESSPSGINRLDPTRPRGNSPVWFRHTHIDHAPAIPTAEAVQWLLVQHFYGPGGGGGPRTVGNGSDHYMTSGPLRGVLTHYPLGRTVFETLITGIPPKGQEEAGEDRAPWEHDELPDPLGHPPAITWPAGLLVGRSRHAVLLHPDAEGTHVLDCRLTWAFKKRHSPVSDPYTIQKRTNNGAWKDRDADADRALWRHLDALLLADTAEHHRPAVLTAATTLPSAVRDALRVRIYGVDQDRQTRDRQWITATTPKIMRWFDDVKPQVAQGAEALHDAAETVADVLRHTLNSAYRSLSLSGAGFHRAQGNVPWVGPALRQYWPAAESVFWHRMHVEDFTEPYRACTRLALDALEATTGHEQHHPAVARELAGARRYLQRFAAKKEPRSQ